MDVKKSTEYQYMPFIVKELEDIAGGGSVALADLRKDIDCVPPGAFVGKDGDGLYHICKSVQLTEDAAGAIKVYKVGKAHQLKVGDIVSCKDRENVKAAAIASINTDKEEYDTLTVVEALGTVEAEGVEAVILKAGDHLVAVKEADAVGGASELVYEPEGITKREIDTTESHASVGLFARGTVNVANMAFGAPDVFKKAMPLVRFD